MREAAGESDSCAMMQAVKTALGNKFRIGTADSWNKYADGTADAVIQGKPDLLCV